MASTEGGRMPRWSGDGRRLFTLNQNAIHAVSVARSAPVGPPQLVTRVPDDTVAFDIDLANGRSLILRRATLPATADEVYLIGNCIDQLRRND